MKLTMPQWIGVGANLMIVGLLVAFFWRVTGFRSALFAFELHFILMASATHLDKVFAPKLDSARFDVSAREARIYRRLGVVGFMVLLRRIGWHAAIRDDRVFDGTRRTIASYERATRHGENAHLCIFLFTLLPIVYAAIRGWWDAVGWILGMGIAFHVYPIMLQRYQRVRLRALLSRTSGAATPSSRF